MNNILTPLKWDVIQEGDLIILDNPFTSDPRITLTITKKSDEIEISFWNSAKEGVETYSRRIFVNHYLEPRPEDSFSHLYSEYHSIDGRKWERKKDTQYFCQVFD